MKALSRSGGSISRRQREGICFLGWHQSAGSPCRAQCLLFCGAIAPRQRQPPSVPCPCSPASRPSTARRRNPRLCGARKSLLALPLIACACTAPRGLNGQRSKNDHNGSYPQTTFFFFFHYLIVIFIMKPTFQTSILILFFSVSCFA